MAIKRPSTTTTSEFGDLPVLGPAFGDRKKNKKKKRKAKRKKKNKAKKRAAGKKSLGKRVKLGKVKLPKHLKKAFKFVTRGGGVYAKPRKKGRGGKGRKK
jgi:hypothetical protein